MTNFRIAFSFQVTRRLRVTFESWFEIKKPDFLFYSLTFMILLRVLEAKFEDEAEKNAYKIEICNNHKRELKSINA